MSDERFMDRALGLARQGLAEGELPVGALVVLEQKIVAEAHWRGDQDRGVLGHPELVALLAADRVIGRRRADAALYTTLEPCLMCMGAAMAFFIGTVVYALGSPSDGAADVARRWQPPSGHPRPAEPAAYRVPEVIGGVRSAEARALVQEYVDSGASGPVAEWTRTLVGS